MRSARAHSRTALRAALLASEASRQSSTSTISAQLPRRWKPSAGALGPVAERVLELVAVAPALDAPARSARARSPRAARAGAAPRRPAPPCERAGSRRAAPAREPRGRGRPRAGSVSAIRSGLGSTSSTVGRLGVVALRLRQPGADPVAGQRAGDEDDVAVGARDPAPALGERVDLELELFAGAVPDCGRTPCPYRCSVATALDLDDYRNSAESFLEAIEREYYLQLAGHKLELEMEPIYERHAGLFSAERIAELRELAEAASGEHAPRAPLPGCSSRSTACSASSTRAETEEVARLEVGRSSSRSAASPCPSARWRSSRPTRPTRSAGWRSKEARRARRLAERLNPLLREALERSHAACRELGWAGYADAYAELRRLDFGALAEQTERVLAGNRGRLRGGVGAPPGGERAAAAGRAAPRRPAALLPRPRARRRLRRLDGWSSRSRGRWPGWGST